MCNKIKNILLGFILGILLSTMIGVGAVYLYNAKDIEFVSTNSEWNVTNVGDALNTLYYNDSNIIKALKDKGLYIDVNSTYDDVFEQLNNISNLKLLGNYSGNQTISLTNIDDYQNRKFYIMNVSIGSSSGSYNTSHSSGKTYSQQAQFTGATPSISIDGSNLMVSGAVSYLKGLESGGLKYTKTINVSYSIYYI